MTIGPDKNGFNPFPSAKKLPGPTNWPGPASRYIATDSQWLSPPWLPYPPGTQGPGRDN